MTGVHKRPINPYIAGRALRQQAGFFGRDDILHLVETELRSPDRNVLVLFGQRRIGKTSILLQLEQQLPSPPFIAVHFDLMDRAKQPLGRLLHDIATALADEVEMDVADQSAFDDVGDYFLQTFLPKLMQQLGADRRAVVLFDEFDVLDVAAEERLPDTAAARAFFPYLRKLIEETPLAFVFVVGRRAEDLSIDIKAAFKVARYKRVSVLTEQDARVLILQAQRQETLQFAPSAVDRIVALTAGHPYLTQLFCQILWDKAHTNRPDTPPEIAVATVDETVADVLEAGQHAFEWIWDGLPPAERVIFAAIANATAEGAVISEEDLLEVLQTHGIRILVRELELAPRTLVEWEMLCVVNSGYTFAVELLRRWVAHNKPLARVREELDQVVPFAETLYRTGEGWYQQRNLTQAEASLRQALNVNPNHLKARLLLGQILIEQENLDAAIEELEQAYQYDQDAARYPLVRTLLGKAERLERAEQPDVDAALGLYERVLILSPRERVAHERQRAIWIARGDSALQELEFDTAINAYEKAEAHDKIVQVEQFKRQHWYSQMMQTAMNYAAQEEWQQAVGILQQLAQEFPADADVQQHLEQAQAELRISKQYSAAIGELEQGNWIKAQRAFADVIYIRPDYKNAAELLVQAVNSVRKSATLTNQPDASPESENTEDAEQTNNRASIEAVLLGNTKALVKNDKEQIKIALTEIYLGVSNYLDLKLVALTEIYLGVSNYLDLKRKISPELLEILADPSDKGPVELLERYGKEWLVNPRNGYCYPVEDGIPIMLVEEGEKYKDESLIRSRDS